MVYLFICKIVTQQNISQLIKIHQHEAISKIVNDFPDIKNDYF